MSNPKTHLFPAKFAFPKPSFRVEESSLNSPGTEAAVQLYLERIGEWRTAVLEFLRDSDAARETQVEALSARARLALETFLADRWSNAVTQYAAASPYNMAAFPLKALEAGRVSNVEALLEVLRWRAGITDYLSDVYDVWGEPALDVFECMAMQWFFRCVSDESLCHLCLTAFDKQKLDPDRHECLLVRHVRAKWPAPPPAFERWRNEASGSR